MDHHFQYLIPEINNFKLMNLNVYNYKIKDTNKYFKYTNNSLTNASTKLAAIVTKCSGSSLNHMS